MKLLSFALLALSFNVFGQVSDVTPTLEKCAEDQNLLTMIQAPVQKFATTVAGDINVMALMHPSGDPAIWSLLHVAGITFPVEGGQACFRIDNAYIKNVKKVKTIGYDAKKGRLLSIPVSIATYDMTKEEFGSKDITLKVRINRLNGGAVTLE